MSEPEEVDKQLQESKKMLVSLSEQMNAVQEQKASTDKELREVRIRENELNSQRLEIANLAAKIRDEMRRTERLISQQELDAKKAEENARVRREYEKQSSEFDELISRFNWGSAAMPHQIEGMKRAALAKRLVLADKPGLGKTLTALGWLDLINAHKILAIVPNDIMGNFIREANRWAPHRSAHIIGGMPKAQVKPLLEFFANKYEGNILMVVNYESWRKNMALISWLQKVQFDTVIVDEAHMIKDMGSIAFRGVKELLFADNKCPKCGSGNILTGGWEMYCSGCGYKSSEFGEFRSVKNLMPMTGTPFLNAPQDAFPLLHLVNATLFPSQRMYLDTYCEKDRYTGKWRFQLGMEERLASKISSMYLARDRDSAGVKLPKQDVVVHEYDFDPEAYPKQWEAYQLLKARSALIMKDLLSEAEDNRAAFPVAAAIALITRQRQMMTWPDGIRVVDPETKQVLFSTDVTESFKMDKVIDPSGEGLIPRIVNDEGDRVVLFSQFKTALAEMHRRLENKGFRVIRYDGDTPKALRQEIQIDFDRATYKDDPNYESKWDIVLCNYKTGGVGLNLNAATQAIVFDEEWNPGKEEQAFGRLDRMGQTEETIVHILRVRDTIDMWMARIIAVKKDMIAGIESQIDLQQELTKILLEGEKK